jgi:hypothetical protein
LKSILTSKISAQTPIILLPPRDAAVPPVFQSVEPDIHLYSWLLAAIQRFRGSLYCQDGAVSKHELTADGRHVLPIDEKSWHVAALNAEGDVCGCLRFNDESSADDFNDLWLSKSSVARCPVLGKKLRPAVEREMERAKANGLRFGEVGGWAIAPERRRSTEALRIILATYALLELLGGCLGMATATLRHGSAGILRRIGLSSVIADGYPFPPYYDAQYDCEMELLQFDSRRANSKFTEWIVELSSFLRTALVVAASPVLRPAESIARLPLQATLGQQPLRAA